MGKPRTKEVDETAEWPVGETPTGIDLSQARKHLRGKRRILLGPSEAFQCPEQTRVRAINREGISFLINEHLG